MLGLVTIGEDLYEVSITLVETIDFPERYIENKPIDYIPNTIVFLIRMCQYHDIMQWLSFDMFYVFSDVRGGIDDILWWGIWRHNHKTQRVAFNHHYKTGWAYFN